MAEDIREIGVNYIEPHIGIMIYEGAPGPRQHQVGFIIRDPQSLSKVAGHPGLTLAELDKLIVDLNSVRSKLADHVQVAMLSAAVPKT